MTQIERIKRHIEDFGSITQAEAVQEYGIFRLASRIAELKNLGYPVVTEMVTGKNRYGDPTHYARYKKSAAG